MEEVIEEAFGSTSAGKALGGHQTLQEREQQTQSSELSSRTQTARLYVAGGGRAENMGDKEH